MPSARSVRRGAWGAVWGACGRGVRILWARGGSGGGRRGACYPGATVIPGLEGVPVGTFGGFLMALADSVPGVSGGTIAFIVGIYDQLLWSLDRLVSGTAAERRRALGFLARLGAGWVVGFGLAVVVLTGLFESEIYLVSSVFMGFIVFSVPLIVRDEHAYVRGRYGNLVWTLAGIAVVVAVTLANAATIGGDASEVSAVGALAAGAGVIDPGALAHGAGLDAASAVAEGALGADAGGIDLAALDLGGAAYLVFAAMIAVSAMILPGVSGSTFLLIFGLYLPVMDAIKALIGGDLAVLPAIALFAVGAVVGLLTVVKLVKRALADFRSQTVYCLLGFMVGSLVAIALGPVTLDVPQPPLTADTFSVAGFLLGGAVIGALELLKHAVQRRQVARAIATQARHAR